MPPKRRGRNVRRTSQPAAGGDRLGALPDDILLLVLSFLPAEDAVRTCVLARRWLHLWKSATGLRIVRNLEDEESVKAVREFVDHLLLLRRGSPLHTFQLSLNFLDLEDEILGDDMSRIKLWIRHVLECKVQVMTLGIFSDDVYVELNGLTLVSNHIRKLQLAGILLEDKLLDFSCCPALEVLEVDGCDFTYACTVSSQSLKCLSINSDCRFDEDSRVEICTPNLHSLRLEVAANRTPILNSMPFLMEAFVELSDCCCDNCPNNVGLGDCEDDDCNSCYGADDDTLNSVLLHGLSKARSLVLISDIDTFIFRRDLRCCPVFGNLRTLLLNEYWTYWCCPGVDAEFCALGYMLEQSPVLEKLTLELYCKGTKRDMTTLKGIPDPIARSDDIISEHLKTVEVKCKSVDRNMKVLKFLSELGICFRFCWD